jgi:hypothetical protein
MAELAEVGIKKTMGINSVGGTTAEMAAYVRTELKERGVKNVDDANLE